MKKPHILNRPMFNKGGTSAYGRGIASNLVTEEQRVRYNAGGRVRLQDGSGYGFKDFSESPLGGFLGDMYRNVPGAIADFAYTPINLAGRLVGYNPGLSARKHIRTSKDLMYGKDREDRMTDEEVEKTSFFGIPFSAKRGFTSERRKKEAEKKEEKTGNKLDDILARADAENKKKAKAEKAAKEAAAAAEANKDPNVIDLTNSERAGLKATLYAGAGAGALDPSNKTVTDVIRSALLGANKAGKEIYDPTTERKYRKYAEAHTNIQDEAFKRKIKWETSDEKLMTDRAATLGKQGAEEEKAVGKQVPKTGTGAEYKEIKKSITNSKKKGTPLAGLIVFDTDIQKYKVWDPKGKEYKTVSDNIDDVKKLLTRRG